MLNEFYKYIANNTVSFFQERADTIRPGERYCLKLDTEEMVQGVDHALREKTSADHIQGNYHYENVYETFTIIISANVEVVVASKTNGMTDDFLATLRNAELTDKHFPILMVTHSPIDTITSGTGDLAANGMPFHATSIIAKIQQDIKSAQLSPADQKLLELELERKQEDRFSDKSSLFEYSNLLTVLGRGYIKPEDFASFSLLYDDELASIPVDKVKSRLQENHDVFDYIDRVLKHGNIADALDKEYDKKFIEHLQEAKRKGDPWYENYTFTMVKASHDRAKVGNGKPLQIEDADIEAFSGSPIEYSFLPDDKLLIRSDGITRQKQRRKNILIYNPDHNASVTVLLHTNISIRTSWVDCSGASVNVEAKTVSFTINASGCAFARASISDPNKNAYLIKICVLNLAPRYLEDLQTKYLLDVPKSLRNAAIQVIGPNKMLIINPGSETPLEARLYADQTYVCNYDQTLQLLIDQDQLDTDTGKISFTVKSGGIELPLQIKDESIRPTELTGISAFKRKFEQKRSFEYRSGKIILGTSEFFAKSPFKENLEWEDILIQNEWLAANVTPDGLEECILDVPQKIRDAYLTFVRAFKAKRQLPSLSYYDESLQILAENYVKITEDVLQGIPAGDSLTSSQNDLLMIGCVIKLFDEHTISMSPLTPLNVLYQLTLSQEKMVGAIRDNLVEKLSPLYLLPYIKASEKELYHVVEQRYSPEWRIYAQATNKRFQGARNFVQKLVCDKIIQYIDHFSFLFEVLGNDQMIINLVSMGDCREILQGLMLFYSRQMKEGVLPENLKEFVINIYNEPGEYNEFSVLSDQKRLREYILAHGRNIEDVGEMAVILGSKIRCFYRNPQEPQYQYAHLTFYEMEAANTDGDSRMDSISTGVALGGLTSGTPSVLNGNWYKTGFGTKYAPDNRLLRMARNYNALFRVAFSGSSYEPDSAIFTSIAHDEKGQLGKIYSSSNWVVFVDPKVDLSFFQGKEQDLMIIHYSDQYTSTSGYDDITVTQKSQQYEEIIHAHLNSKGISATKEDVHNIISLFNAINGDWMLRLIPAKKLAGAVDSNFSREKMSILSAIKMCMAYYSHEDIVWIPISLEEMLRVSRGAGYSQADGLLSAKNLGFEKGATSDDVLMIGIEGPVSDIKVYLHPVEVKIGQNTTAVLAKAQEQVLNTYAGLWNALWPNENRDSLECKLSRNFLMQMAIVSCEKMCLYNVYPDIPWQKVLKDFREALLNEQYTFSKQMDSFLGKGTIVSFKTDVLNKSGKMQDDICLLEFPEKMGSEYMIKSAAEIEKELDNCTQEFPDRIKYLHRSSPLPSNAVLTDAITEVEEVRPETTERQQVITDPPLTPVDEDQAENSSTSESNPHKEASASEETAEEAKNTPTVSRRKCMEIIFGKDISTGAPLIWKPNDTNQVFHTNMGIIGTMGTGKTQFTKSLIAQLHRDQAHNFDGSPLGILIFDYKGDYNESKEDFIDATKAKVFKPYHLPFNPLAITASKVFKPLLPIHTANAFKDTLAKVYNLGAKQQNSLFSCITRAYSATGVKPNDPSTWKNTPPTFDMVYNIYMDDEDIKKTDSLAAAMDKLYQFQVFESDSSKTQSLFDLLNGVIVIDLSGYDPDIQSLIVAITLDLFYVQMQAAGSSKMDQQYRQLTKFILVDEADNFMSQGFPSLKKILKEGREFGVGTVLSTQFLKHFGTTDDDYAKYILTWVVHNVADLKPSDVEFVFNTEAKSPEAQRLFSDIKALQKHYSIVKIGTSKPIYIQDRAFWELYNDWHLI